MTIPVTARAEGFVPPNMSCMKNVSGWSWPIAAPPVAVVDAATGGTVDSASSLELVSASRIRAELAEVIVMARKKRDMKRFKGREMEFLWDAIVLKKKRILFGVCRRFVL